MPTVEIVWRNEDTPIAMSIIKYTIAFAEGLETELAVWDAL